jgi:hypothetical protein
MYLRGFLTGLMILPVLAGACGSKNPSPQREGASVSPDSSGTSQAAADQKGNGNQDETGSGKPAGDSSAKNPATDTKDPLAEKQTSDTTTIKGTTAPVASMNPASVVQPQASATPMPSFAPPIVTFSPPPAASATPAPSATPVNIDGTITEFLTSIYWACLGRAPDGPGLAYWKAEMQAKRLTTSNGRTAVCAVDEAGIADIYFRILSRDPDAPGMAYWLSQKSMGMSLAVIETSLSGSAEAKTLTQTTKQNFAAVRSQREATFTSAQQKAVALRIPSSAP